MDSLLVRKNLPPVRSFQRVTQVRLGFSKRDHRIVAYIGSSMSDLRSIKGISRWRGAYGSIMMGSQGKFSFFRQLLLSIGGAAVVPGLIAFALLCVPQIRGQSQDAINPSALSFEVASIKPDHLDGHSTRISYDANSFLTSGTTLKLLIEFAYNIQDVQLSGGPDWVGSETYQVQAKIDHEAVAAMSKLAREQAFEQRRALVQNLLAERFNLKLAHSTKELPIYALIVAKNGHKFSQPASTDNAHAGVSSHNGEVKVTAQTMSRFAEWLSGRVGRKVIDKTGLEGRYDFAFTYDDRRQALVAALPAEGTPAALPDPSGPSIFTALHDQVGLQLESQKGPVEVFVIESAERPSPN
jgi:bla regulator protein blaR1